MAERLHFSRARRLRQATEFTRVRKEGKSIRGELLTLAFLKDAERVPARAGFVTSRRVGDAVVRNRIRRRLREIVRKHQHQLVNGSWIITIALGRASGARFAELEGEWLRLAERASILAR